MALEAAFISGIARRSKLDPAEWAAKHVVLPRSTDSSRFQPEFTPWWREVMREGADNRNSIITILGPVGSGKSTMIEAFNCWAIDQRPGPTLIIGQTDADVTEWGETGLVPALQKCEPIKAQIPGKRHGLTKDKILVPGMPIHLTGANMSGLQSKSELWVWADERWMYKEGMGEELKNRTHRRWNARVFMLGQAGFLEEGEEGEPIGDEFTVECYMGEQREWMFACPQCGDVQPYTREQIKYPDEGSIPQRAAACVYECGNCSTAFDDTSKSRRQFAKSARYEVIREAKMPRQIHFHLNAWALWRSPWAETLTKYLKAKEAQAWGNSKPMEQYQQKQEAVPWADTTNSIDLDLGEPYSKHDYWPKEGEEIPRWPEEAFREMKIDVQSERSKVPFWARIRTWKVSGDSRLLWEGKANSIEEIRRTQLRFGVPNENVGIDVGYEIDRVAGYIDRFRDEKTGQAWWGMRGDKKQSWAFKGGTQRPYSPVKTYVSSAGARILYVFWSNLIVKDVMAGMINGERQFDIFHDHSRDYGQHMESEAREEMRPGVYEWTKKRKRNDLWDCEAMGVAHAIWRGVIQWVE